MRSWKPLAWMLAVTVPLLLTLWPPVVPRLVWNASESVPVGLYAVQPAGRLEVSGLVLAQPPEPLAAFLAEGAYLGAGVPLLKRIAALPGQTVCRDGLELKIDGTTWAEARAEDRLGRPLPRWSGCRTLAEGEVFLLNWDEPTSLDGRYFGPLPASSIVGRATPVWTDAER